MLGEVTHLQTISDDLKSLTSDPHKLPPASEQVTLFSCQSKILLKRRSDGGITRRSLPGYYGPEGLGLSLVLPDSALFPKRHHVQEVQHVQVGPSPPLPDPPITACVTMRRVAQ